MSLYSFVASSIIIILLPGTGVIYTIATGISKGKKASMIAAVGCTAGIIPHLCVSIALSSLLLNLNERAFNVVKMLGVFYLLYLGIGMILSNSKLDFDSEEAADKPGHMIRRGILINLLNPKLTIFFFSFLPQYVSNTSDVYVLKSFLLGLAFMLLTFLVFCAYGFLAGTLKEVILKSEKRQKHIQQLFGLVFIAFSIKLLIS